jgi:hypothetical protein
LQPTCCSAAATSWRAVWMASPSSGLAATAHTTRQDRVRLTAAHRIQSSEAWRESF